MPKDTQVFNDTNFEQKVHNASGVVVVDFWAQWCGPCRALSPTIDAIATENKDVVVGKVNTDDSPKVSQDYQISTIPTVIVFKNGRPVARLSSGITKTKLQQAIDDALN